MRKISFQPGHAYHLYNRGVDRQPIFFQDQNWGFFIRRLRAYFDPGLIDLIAYCLMPTHYHLLVYLKTSQLSKRIMQPLGVSYAKAINRQQNRVGPLFQGPFRAKLVDRDAYLSHLTRYIHLNPVAAGLVDSPAGWRYSSYLDYIGLRQGTLPRPDIVLSQFPSRAAYQRYVEGSDDTGLQLIEHLLMD
jgi:REP element-mobilizing transposase RayT